mmetsp:Transcript_80991/g.262371  ORF Transcript_80991/g.262371 Transcript_80991/m.262371 type:complete len:255 (+) Transcript_80991:468-1232(+)
MSSRAWSSKRHASRTMQVRASKVWKCTRPTDAQTAAQCEARRARAGRCRVRAASSPGPHVCKSASGAVQRAQRSSKGHVPVGCGACGLGLARCLQRPLAVPPPGGGHPGPSPRSADPTVSHPHQLAPPLSPRASASASAHRSTSSSLLPVTLRPCSRRICLSSGSFFPWSSAMIPLIRVPCSPCREEEVAAGRCTPLPSFRSCTLDRSRAAPSELLRSPSTGFHPLTNSTSDCSGCLPERMLTEARSNAALRAR